jgi:type I restriction enzyme, S subunit
VCRWDGEIKKIREIVSYYVGGGWGEEKQSNTFSEGAYVIRGTDIPKLNSGVFLKEIYRYHKPSNFKSRELKQNDFLFEVSGGSKDQAIGRNLLITKNLLRFFDNKLMGASFCKQIRFNSNLVSPYFIKYFLKLYYDCDLVSTYQIQSTGISNYQFESFLSFQEILLPPIKVQAVFDNIIHPLLNHKDNLAQTMLNLKKTRDVLIGQLISGKLSVENLDIQFPPSMLEETEPEPQETAYG